MSCKNKGNKYFRGGRYELAIKCYTEAIDLCPKAKKSDLSTFYQNRAAAYEQLVSFKIIATSILYVRSVSLILQESNSVILIFKL